jgi:ankyrin repeat protein
LLEIGKVNVDSKGSSGQTLLSGAALYGREAIVKLLLEIGKVDIDLKDSSGQTPLSGAALYGREAIVKLLLETRSTLTQRTLADTPQATSRSR